MDSTDRRGEGGADAQGQAAAASAHRGEIALIFTLDNVDKILTGEKTQTRRLARGPCKYRVGQDYSVQPGRTKREVARIAVTGIRREALGEIGHRDARAEGYPSTTEFWDAWSDLHGGFSRDDLVDVIDFVLVAEVTHEPS
jgi:hypothetical protein